MKSCEKNSERVDFFYWRKGNLDFEFPIKMLFFANLRIIVESSPIAHSMGNFILKNFNSEHFLIKLISDEIWRHIHIWRHIILLDVEKFYIMYGIQLSHLISGCRFQHVGFASITSGSICKCVLTSHIFVSPHRVSSLPNPTNSNIQSFSVGWGSFFYTKNYFTLRILVPKYSQILRFPDYNTRIVLFQYAGGIFS